jgi:hypothetical protein
MGAYAPAPIATPIIMERIMREAIKPTIDGMRKDGAQKEVTTGIFFNKESRFSIRGLVVYGVHIDRVWT